MTEPKVLADALVVAGIVARHSKEGLLLGQSYNVKPSVLVNDWRVAGKVLELMGGREYGWPFQFDGKWCMTDEYVNDICQHESLPRAIIEAWYAARETE